MLLETCIGREYIEQCDIIAKNLKQLRNERGLSLGKLSKELNMPKGTLGYLECGYSRPSIERLRMIATYYNVTIEYLLTRH